MLTPRHFAGQPRRIQFWQRWNELVHIFPGQHTSFLSDRLTLINSTVTGNSSDSAYNGIRSNLEVLTIANSIVANGADGDCFVPADVFANTEITIHNSLLGTEGCGVTSNNAGNNRNIITDNPRLRDLANGVHLLAPNSEAVDAGSNMLDITISEATLGVDIDRDGNTDDEFNSIDDFITEFRDAGSFFTDQRGQDRVVNGTIDMGAVEYNTGDSDEQIDPEPTEPNNTGSGGGGSTGLLALLPGLLLALRRWRGGR